MVLLRLGAAQKAREGLMPVAVIDQAATIPVAALGMEKPGEPSPRRRRATVE